jgi:diguanylate cyclase (GGDEF)-like protein
MSKPKLLIIEDCILTSSILKQIAISAGYDVNIYNSLISAKEAFNKNRRIDIVISNYIIKNSYPGQCIEYFIKHSIPTIVFSKKQGIQIQKEIMRYKIIEYISNENTQAFLYLSRILKSQIRNKEIEVLIVDDSFAAIRHIEQLLTRRNFKTYHAKNGSIALDVLEKNPEIKIIITDHEMPIMDGIELTYRIRDKHPKGTKNIIGISGLDSERTHVSLFLKNGADDFIRKPFSDSEFYCRLMQSIEMLEHIETQRKFANTDYLTGLSNRRFFFEQVGTSKFQNRMLNENHAIAILDIDHFKSINDVHGHDVGDIALKSFSDIIKVHFNEELNARIGGEEFVILIIKEKKTEILSKLENFRIAVEGNLIRVGELNISFTVSIGCVVNSNSDLDARLLAADSALYSAKNSGRNRVVFTG